MKDIDIVDLILVNKGEITGELEVTRALRGSKHGATKI